LPSARVRNGEKRMHIINVRNVHEALPLGLRSLREYGVKRESRNGPVLMFPEPVATVYANPRERVVFWPQRDANPFFHFAESLWMLDGRRDVATLSQFVGRMKDYSDDGDTFHGAYGYRWRTHFGGDQLEVIIAALSKDPTCRRQVLTMWDPAHDIGGSGKDLPCNTHAYFSVNARGAVDMTVCNRSNDLVWGAYGANAVHFSYLLEFVAAALQRPVGTYTQMSNNLHVYVDKLASLRELATILDFENPYERGTLAPFRLFTDGDHREFLSQLKLFMRAGAYPMMSTFFRRVAQPIFESHAAFRERTNPNRFRNAFAHIGTCRDSAWRRACTEWLARRQKAAGRAADDGPTYPDVGGER
jgi:thymidylate synthase